MISCGCPVRGDIPVVAHPVVFATAMTYPLQDYNYCFLKEISVGILKGGGNRPGSTSYKYTMLKAFSTDSNYPRNITFAAILVKFNTDYNSYNKPLLKLAGKYLANNGSFEINIIATNFLGYTTTTNINITTSPPAVPEIVIMKNIGTLWVDPDKSVIIMTEVVNENCDIDLSSMNVAWSQPRINEDNLPKLMEYINQSSPLYFTIPSHALLPEATYSFYIRANNTVYESIIRPKGFFIKVRKNKVGDLIATVFNLFFR